jgi:hypothetical protein
MKPTTTDNKINSRQQTAFSQQTFCRTAIPPEMSHDIPEIWTLPVEKSTKSTTDNKNCNKRYFL